ncbi:MAG: tetratricopeptide repeat protein, partial [Armatimonadetes bacterium]|nr:tetratricopeptide repeat protein [Armatimonadota bacterium]
MRKLLIKTLVLSGLVLIGAGSAPAQNTSVDKEAAAEFERGVAAIQAGKWDAALAAFKKVTQKYPNAAPAYVNLGIVYRARNDNKNAEAMLKKGLSLEPSNLVGQRMLADLYISQRKWKEAAPLVRKVAAAAPDDFASRMVLGQVEFSLGNLTAAEKEWKKASSIDPKNPAPLRSLAGIYVAKRQTKDLESTLKALQKIQPDDPRIALDLAGMSVQSGDNEEAVTWYKRALSADPENLFIL